MTSKPQNGPGQPGTGPNDPEPGQDPETPPQPTPGDSQDDQNGTGDDDKTGGGNAEAARYRRQLRETEAQRDALQTQLAAMQDQAIATALAGRLADPDDLARYGTDRADLITESGAIDHDRLDAAVNDLLRSRPYLKPAPTPGDHGGHRKTAAPSGSGWGDLLRRDG